MLTLPFAKNLNYLLLKSAISVGFLSVIFYFVPVSKVFAVIVMASPLWLLVGIFLQIMLRVFTALRMQAIAKVQGIDTDFMTMLRILFTSTFYNIIAPGALAGGAVTYIKYRQYGIKPVAAVANIYANKFIELLVVALSAPLFWLLDKDFAMHWVMAYGLIMVAVFGCTFGLLFGRFGNLQWLESSISQHGNSVVHQALTALCRQLGQIGRISHAAIASLVAYSVVYCLLAAIAIICFGKALGFDIELLTILWVYPLIYLLAVLPISISNVGVREAGMIMLLAPYGINTAEAIAWSVLMYTGPLSSGLVGLIFEAEYFWLHKQPARDMEPADEQIAAECRKHPKRAVSEERSG